ncbi:calcium/calmodulin-dependent protein kinase [Achlya hypogyna]|uniref:Calcium/calmodulin-dependent protein kinase n=1 Tax=Achlya hypogyna TaxID=1202772 RepID=A0A1V9YBG9_ACHHY|nr:calcium/calmodulin-dependent protein kinase [Achlya hypogyna]
MRFIRSPYRSLDEADESPVLGAFADSYKLGKFLGDGSFAVVREGTSQTTGATVAIKCIKKSVPLRDVSAEVAFVKALDHPNVVKVHDVFVERTGYYVVMEYLRGGDLYDRLHKKGIFDEQKTRLVMHGLLQAVHHCHKRKIVHRDLKPENVLLVDDESDVAVKLADFGFAAKVGAGELIDFCGTAGYAAPEIAKGLPYGLPVDIWSLGVVMFVLLTGNLPFGTDRETFRAMCPLSPPPVWYHPYYWNNVSADCQRFLERMLVVEPECRATAEELLADPWFRSMPRVERKSERRTRFRRGSSAVVKYLQPIWKRVSSYLPRRQPQEFSL